MANKATLSGTGTSDWVDCVTQVPHRIDVDVPATVSSITYTIETTHDKVNGRSKTIKKPNDVDTTWSFSASTAIEVTGAGYFRINVSAVSGTGSVTITAGEAESA